MSMTGLALALVATPAASAGECNGSPRAAILISTNSDFTAANGVVSGSGTKADPYLIANWAINDLSQGYAVKVDNSAGKITKSFSITCISSNWNVATAKGGYVVWIVNVHTATTISMVLSNSGELPNSNGIRIESSSAIRLTDESFNKMGGDGIQLVGSDHITVIASKSKASGNGLLIENSYDITVGQKCSLGSGNGCNEFTYDDGRGILIHDSYNVQVTDTITSADDTGGILLEGSATSGIMLKGGDATANGPICHSGIATGLVTDTIAGISVTTGAHDITVRGYTIQANGDGAGGYFDLMNGGNGLYMSPCGGPIVQMSPTPPGGANLDFNGNCYHFELGFTPPPTSTC